MAESRTKVEFQNTKKLFEAVAENVVCCKCKVVPRRGPIYQSNDLIPKNKDGDSEMPVNFKRQRLNEENKEIMVQKICCGNCLPKPDRDEIFQKSLVIENILLAFPVTSCKFRKNDCKVVQDLKNIEYHEEECDFRDIPCPCPCTEMIKLNSLEEHIKENHQHKLPCNFLNDTDNSESGIEIQGKVIKLQYKVDEDVFEADGITFNCYGIAYFHMHGKLFFLHIQSDDDNVDGMVLWIQIWGSKFETKNYNCSIQVGDSTHGQCLFKGPVKSLDDNRKDAFKKQYGLLLSGDFLKKLVGDKFMFKIEVEVEDLKGSEEQPDFDVEPMEATTANDDQKHCYNAK